MFAPTITPGIPTVKNLIIKGISKFILVMNLLVAPIPNATVAILWTARAFMKAISNNNNIAGSCITPAPPPENAENIFDISEIKNRYI